MRKLDKFESVLLVSILMIQPLYFLSSRAGAEGEKEKGRNTCADYDRLAAEGHYFQAVRAGPTTFSS